VTERLPCRLCGGGLEPSAVAESEIICKNCGTKNRITYSHGECIVGDVLGDRELELRERIEEFARLRNYDFNDTYKEPVIQALLQKRERSGDFYCPCKARTIAENLCPCKETREGDVELNGCCSCRLFWKKSRFISK
jgi:ferredoxin-thioredoxin reductase catalytic subunit